MLAEIIFCCCKDKIVRNIFLLSVKYKSNKLWSCLLSVFLSTEVLKELYTDIPQ